MPGGAILVLAASQSGVVGRKKERKKVLAMFLQSCISCKSGIGSRQRRGLVFPCCRTPWLSPGTRRSPSQHCSCFPCHLSSPRETWLNLRLVFNYASNFTQAWLVFRQGYNTDCCSFFKKNISFRYLYSLYVLNIVLLLLLEDYLSKCLYVICQTWGNGRE